MTDLETAPAGAVNRSTAVSTFLQIITSRFGLVLLDQAFCSAGTFSLNVMAARLMLPSDYGVYALFLGVLIFFAGLHSALITTPLIVEATAAEEGQQLQLYSLFSASTVALHVIPAAAVCIYAVVTATPSVIPPAVLALIWQLQETARRFLLVRKASGFVLGGDLIAYGGGPLCVYLASQQIVITSSVIFMIQAAAFAAGFLLQSPIRGVSVPSVTQLRTEWTRIWHLASWNAGTSLASGLYIMVYLFYLSGFHTAQQAAEFQALINILGMTHPLLFALTFFVTSETARLATRLGSQAAAWRQCLVRLGWIVVLPAPLLALIFALPDELLHLFYAGAPAYSGLSTALRWMALVYWFIFTAQFLCSYLTGIRRSDAVFALTFKVGIVSALVGIPAVYWYGTTGAATALVIVHSLRTALAYRSIVRLTSAAPQPI